MPDEFDALDLGELDIKIVAYNKEIDRERRNMWELGQLIAVGHHDPNHYPSLEDVLGGNQHKRRKSNASALLKKKKIKDVL